MLTIIKKFNSFDQTCHFKPSREYFRLLLNFLLEIFSSRSGALNIINSDLVRSIGYFTNADERDHLYYVNHMRRTDPMNIEYFIKHRLVNRPVQRSIINVSDSDMPEAFRDYLIKKDIYKSILILFKCSNNFYAFLSLDRGSVEPSFTDSELGLMTELSPFIANSINTNLMYQQLNNFNQLFMTIPLQDSLIFLNKTTKTITCDQETSELWKKLNPVCSVYEFAENTLSELLNQNNEFVLYDAGNNAYRLRVFTSDNCDSVQVIMITPEGSDVILDSKMLNLLTPKERKIVILLTRGYTNRDIGNILCISENTVKVHLKNIFQRTGARRRTELINKMICG